MGYVKGDRIPPGVVDGGTYGSGPLVSQAFGCTWFQQEWSCPGCPAGMKFHAGIDLVAPYMTTLRAVGWGIVFQVGRGGGGCGGLGSSAVGIRSGGVDSWYGHCATTAAGIGVGSIVMPGQAVAYMGYRGCVDPWGLGGTHLHFEVMPATVVDGCRALDPTPYLTRWPGQAPVGTAGLTVGFAGPSSSPIGPGVVVVAGVAIAWYGWKRRVPSVSLEAARALSKDRA
jgi:murein DD-endopeptidase MepM/ murein hydrolase activator NlpD